MGNETSSIFQKLPRPQLTQSKTFTSALAHLPKANHTVQKRVSFVSDTKKSSPKKLFNSRKRANTLGTTNSFKYSSEKLGKSNSSRDSCMSKITESSYDDSSSTVVIDRLGKNCKLVGPSHLHGAENMIAGARDWMTRRFSGERAKVVNLLEYNPAEKRRNQTNTNSGRGDFLLSTNEELGLDDIYEHLISADRFSFGDTVNYPNFPSSMESNEGGKMSTATRSSEVSVTDGPLTIAVSRSDVHSTSDSVKHRNCLTCGKYTDFDRGSTQPEHNQQAQEVHFISTFCSSSTLLEVLPVNKQFSVTTRPKVQHRQVTSNTQIPSSSIKVIWAD